MGLSLPHILLLLVVAALLLGGGRLSALMGDVAKGVKQFKAGMAEDETAPVSRLQRTNAAAGDAPREVTSATPTAVPEQR